MKMLKSASILFAIHSFVVPLFISVAHADRLIVSPTIKVTPYYFYVGNMRTEELISLNEVAENTRDVDWVVEASECAEKERVSRAISFAKKHAGKYKSVSVVKNKLECF